MAFMKPVVNTISADITNLSIYLRSTKKFGKTTLFRDVVLEKYGDPNCGLLVGCGNEVGYKMLDNLQVTQVNSWEDILDLKEWLIEGKKNGEHNIKIVAFDTVDELALLADRETIRQSNLENPAKKIKSIKAAFGGYTAGEKYSANDLIKPLMTDLELAGFGVWGIAHTKFKTIKEKGSTDEEGYMQLSSNLGADYESAFGDCFDVVLTGVIDRDVEEKGDGKNKKRYATDEIRKLYFRGTSLIDAGGRFADGAVPEFMVFDKRNMAPEFVKTIEDGMEKSKTTLTTARNKKKSDATAVATPKPTIQKTEPKVEEPVEEAPAEENSSWDDLQEASDKYMTEPAKDAKVEEDDLFAEEEESYPDDLKNVVKGEIKALTDKSLKVEIQSYVTKTYGSFAKITQEGLWHVYDMLHA